MIIYCDGGSRGNPGLAASAFVVTENEKVIYKESKFIGTDTNNVAEYTAVLIALKWLSENKTSDEVVFNLDSQLVERQLNGVYKIKNENLKKYVKEIKEIISKENLKVKFMWGYRSNNKLADSLVNEELDSHASTGK